MRLPSPGLALAVSFSALSGCATSIVETSAPPGLSTNPKVGVVYYLPKALIPITITAGDVAAGGGPAQQPPASQVVVNNTVTNNNALPAKPGAAEAPNPKPAAFAKFYTIAVAEPKLIADTQQEYFLSYRPEIASADDVTIAVDSNGLLQSGKATSTDQSGAIVVKIAELIGELAKIPVAFGGLPSPAFSTEAVGAKDAQGRTAVGYVCAPRKPFQVKALIDADNDAGPEFTATALSAALREQGAPISLALTPLFAPDPATTPAGISPDAPQAPAPGIYLRSNRPYRLHIQIDNRLAPPPPPMPLFDAAQVDDARKAGIYVALDPNELVGLHVCDVREGTEDVIVMLPNESPVWNLEISRAAFVTKTTDYTLQNGMLTKVTVSKPSQLLAAVGIPLEIVKEIISIPAELLTLRIKQMESAGTLTKDQGALVEAQVKLIQQQQELDKLRQSLGTQQTAPAATATP